MSRHILILVENLSVPFTAVAADLIARKEVWFQTGPVAVAIRASISIPGASATGTPPPWRTNAAESGVPSTHVRAPASPRSRKYAGIKPPDVTKRSGAIATPYPANRAAYVDADRDASLVTIAYGWPRRSSSASNAPAPGKIPASSTRTP